MTKYLALAYELKDLISHDPSFLNYLEKEKIMENDEEVMALAYNKDLKETYLSDALKHFSHDSKEVRQARLELFRASERLDSHPVVKEYLLASKKLDEIYDAINDILFEELKNKCV